MLSGDCERAAWALRRAQVDMALDRHAEPYDVYAAAGLARRCAAADRGAAQAHYVQRASGVPLAFYPSRPPRAAVMPDALMASETVAVRDGRLGDDAAARVTVVAERSDVPDDGKDVDDKAKDEARDKILGALSEGGAAAVSSAAAGGLLTALIANDMPGVGRAIAAALQQGIGAGVRKYQEPEGGAGVPPAAAAAAALPARSEGQQSATYARRGCPRRMAYRVACADAADVRRVYDMRTASRCALPALEWHAR